MATVFDDAVTGPQIASMGDPVTCPERHKTIEIMIKPEHFQSLMPKNMSGWMALDYVDWTFSFFKRAPAEIAHVTVDHANSNGP